MLLLEFNEVINMSDFKAVGNPYIESIFYKLAETARVSELMARNFYKSYFEHEENILELDEFKILSHILHNPNLSQSDISKLVYKGKAHVGKILNEMEKKNYITRVLSSKNNIMVKHTVLTPKGENIFKYTDEKFKQLGEQVLSTLSADEIQAMKVLLGKLKTAMLEKNKIYF